MSKHKTLAIEFYDLLGHVRQGSDAPWRDVLCLPNNVLDKLEEAMKDCDDSELEALLSAYDKLERQLIESLRGTWWLVGWPEHVINARFDSDANYGQCASREEALEGADEEYCA